MIVNVMTNNYQERHEDMQQHVKEMESEMKVLRMELMESEEINETQANKIMKLESENRVLKAKLAKVMRKNEETKADQ
jgi:hypothetical protein